MLKARNLLLVGLQPHSSTASHFMLMLFFILTFLSIPWQTHASQLENVYVGRWSLEILEGDVLTIYIYPVVRDISLNSSGSGIFLSIRTNYTVQSQENTAIWMLPESQGVFNMTMSFQSDEAFDYTIGVYSRNPDFYGKSVKFSGDFGTIYTHSGPPGNWTIIILLTSQRQSRSIFHIELPTPVNAALFLAAAGFISYFNIFFVCDTYFKNKKESVSNRRWLVCGIVMVISAFAIYQLYSFTTFTSSWSV